MVRAAVLIVVGIASAAVAAQIEPAAVQQRIEAARIAGGDQWRDAAAFFCSTEEQVAAMKILPSATEGDVEAQRAEPMKVFDNLYFIGQKAVATWALTTSDGIILIDSGYADRVDDTLVAGLRKVGLDARNIRLALIAHGHSDHYGGARALQDRFGTRIGVGEEDWALIERDAKGDPKAAVPRRDLVLRDGMPVVLGDTQVMVVSIPGHTPGSLGFLFPVRDGGRTHTAALFGGTILNPARRFPAAQFEQYLKSVERFRAAARERRADVQLLNHPIMDGLFTRLARLPQRAPRDPHPLVVDEDGVRRFVTVMAECAQAQIARRRS